jgi:pyochelin synthetase
VLAVSALDFDLSVYDIFGLLGRGGTLVLPDKERSRDPLHWAELLEREQVTIWNSVPALLELLLDYVGSASLSLPKSLRLILLSGDWIPLGLPERVRALLPDTQLISLGGATEASVWSIFHPIDHVDPAWNSIPYGKPLTNQRFHVLDSRMEDRPTWATGELYIGGLGVAQGYWRDPAETAARFVHHPLTGERLYRTGDLGRYLPDGNIEFLGRIDNQVKLQGYRIELGEIEAVLAQHPDVQLACATIRDGDRAWPASDAPGSKRGGYKQLIAHVVLSRGVERTEAELREYLRQKLPEHMVPHRIMVLSELPLSANGKVDRRALPDPTPLLAPSARAFVPARSVEEHKLAELWSQLLDVRPVGVSQDFFELGGDSVLAVRLFARISQAFGRTLPVSTLFTHPTIESMAPLLAEHATEPRPPGLSTSLERTGS